MKEEYLNQQFYYKKSRLQQLKGFCYTVQEGNAKKAADKMGLGASAITMQIKSLERDLKVELFKRTKNHRLEITLEGQRFYEMAILQLQGIDSLFENFHKTIKLENENILNIAVHHTVGTFIISKYIKKLLEEEEFKNVKIKLSNLPMKDIYKKIINKEIDFAFYSSSDNKILPVEIEEKKVFRYRTNLVVHKNHPLANKKKISKADLENHPYLVRDKFSSFGDIKKYLNLNSKNISFENATQEMTLSFVSENIGMSIVAEKLLENKIWKINDHLICKNVNHLFPEIFYSLFYLKNFIPKRCAKFILNEILADAE